MGAALGAARDVQPPAFWQMRGKATPLRKRAPKWLVAAQIVETSRVYAREVGAIEPEWALGVNPDLLKRHYYEPRWNARRGQAVAFERITLYGLTLADKRPVHYGPLAPAESRELMIRDGLVAGNFRLFPPYSTRPSAGFSQ